MIKTTERKLVVGLEIGIAKVAVLVGEANLDGMINIIGIGSCPSRGIDKNGVNDLELIVKCVQRAINQAELMADCQITSVYLSISSKHINCQNEIGIMPISEKEVTREDVENVIYIARSVRIKDEHQILHVIPQDYSIDSQDGIKNPVGLSGVRMKAKVHLITCYNEVIKNIVKVVEKCGIKVDQLIFSGLASSYSVLTNDEKDLGVCLADIGGGTMDIVIYTAGSLRHTKVIPYAGNIVTNDISYVFKMSKANAEIIKVRYGCVLSSDINKNESFEIQNSNGDSSRNLYKKTLAEVIEPRYTELLNLIKNEVLYLQNKLKTQNINHRLTAGIVLTGGASLISGLTTCAKKIFHTHVRIGNPINIVGLTDYAKEPYYSTTIGLLRYGKEHFLSEDYNIDKQKFINSWIKKFVSWLRKEF